MGSNKAVAGVFIVSIVAMFSVFILPEIYDEIIQQHSDSRMFKTLRIFLAIFILFVLGGSLGVKWG